MGGLPNHVADVAGLWANVHWPGAGLAQMALTYDDGPNDPYTGA